MRLSNMVLALVMPAIAVAETYLSENFANYIPSTFTLVNVDGGSMQPYIYSRMGDDPRAPWVAGQLASGYGRAALSPTRRAGADCPSDRRMILPPLSIGSVDAVVQWEGRSLHRHLPESYRVAVRQAGTDEWSDIYVCDSESDVWAMHSVPLADYVGTDIEIAFIATTDHGFILAIDNIFVGVPETDKFTFSSNAPHYVGDAAPVTIGGTLVYYGLSSQWTSVCLTVGDEMYTQPLSELRCGDSVEIQFTLNPAVGQRYDYKISALAADAPTEIYADFVSCSYYPRMHVVDRGSGTWCPQCPVMELTTSRLEHLYGNEIMVLETHINDALTNVEYWNSYLEGNVYSIPCLIPNHDLSSNTTSLKTSDDFSSKLHAETIAMIDAEATYIETGEVRVTSKVTFAYPADNTDDRYRVGYMLVGNVNDAANAAYMQSLSVSNFNGDQYFHMPDNIMPEMMYFDNVPLSAESAYRGVPRSLPSAIPMAQAQSHEYTVPPYLDIMADNKRILAMLIDTADGTVINATVVDINDPTAITDIDNDIYDGDAIYYDICGRTVSDKAKGLVIKKQGPKATKHIN